MKKFFVACALFFAFAFPVVSHAQTIGIDTPLDQVETEGFLGAFVGEQCLTNGNCSVCDIMRLVVGAAQVMTQVAGGITLVVFLIGAFMLITSQGDPNKVGAGKKAMTGAITGLIIVLLAWPIVNIVIQTVVPAGDDPYRLRDSWNKNLERACAKIEAKQKDIFERK